MFEALFKKIEQRREEMKQKALEDREKRYKENLDRVKYLRAEKAKIDAEVHLEESRKKRRELGR